MLGGDVIVDVNGFLGDAVNKLSPTSENFVALSSTIASHEIAHMYGVRHHDAFGAPGDGILRGCAGIDSCHRIRYWAREGQ